MTMKPRVSKELEELLWGKHLRAPTLETRNALWELYYGIVWKIAFKLADRLTANVAVDDLVGPGTFGLLEALRLFDPARGFRFRTFMGKRIKGAMLDWLRNYDFVPRLTRARAKKVAQARHRLEALLGRKPTDRELVAELGITLEEFAKLYVELAPAMAIPEEDKWAGRLHLVRDSRVENPPEAADRHDTTERLLAKLKGRELEVVELYYYRGLTLKEAGKVLGISESRACQVHYNAITRLKEIEMKKRRPEQQIPVLVEVGDPKVAPPSYAGPKMNPRVFLVVEACKCPPGKRPEIWINERGQKVKPPMKRLKSWATLAEAGQTIKESLGVDRVLHAIQYRQWRFGICARCWALPDKLLDAKAFASRAGGSRSPMVLRSTLTMKVAGIGRR